MDVVKSTQFSGQRLPGCRLFRFLARALLRQRLAKQHAGVGEQGGRGQSVYASLGSHADDGSHESILVIGAHHHRIACASRFGHSKPVAVYEDVAPNGGVDEGVPRIIEGDLANFKSTTVRHGVSRHEVSQHGVCRAARTP